MPATMNPNPVPDADGSVPRRGMLNSVAQAVAGAKTFLGTIIASAGVQLASLWNTNGTGATDVCVIVGTSTADGSVNTGAKLFVVADGIGGTRVDKMWVDKVSDIRSASGRFRGSSANGFVASDDSFGASLNFLNNTLNVTSAYLLFTNQTVGGNIFKLANDGTVSFGGTDSTGTPGAATINKPTGKSSIAAGASSVVVSNSLATAAMHCVFSAHARDATCKELIAVCGAGTITFSGSAAATAAIPLSWELKGLI